MLTIHFATVPQLLPVVVLIVRSWPPPDCAAVTDDAVSMYEAAWSPLRATRAAGDYGMLSGHRLIGRRSILGHLLYTATSLQVSHPAGYVGYGTLRVGQFHCTDAATLDMFYGESRAGTSFDLVRGETVAAFDGRLRGDAARGPVLRSGRVVSCAEFRGYLSGWRLLSAARLHEYGRS